MNHRPFLPYPAWVWLALLAFAHPALAQEDASPEADAAESSSQEEDAQESETDSTPLLDERISFEIIEGVHLEVQPPHGWKSNGTEDPVIPELAQIPDARAVLSHSFTHTRRRGLTPQLTVLCATVPSTEWAAGMRPMVFERLNTMAQSRLGEAMSISEFSFDEVQEDLPLYRQTFRASGTGAHRREGGVRVLEADPIDAPSRDTVVGSGQHLLGFVSDPDRALVCSAACVESSRKNRGACAAAIASFQLKGQFEPEPSPTIAGRFLLAVKQRPSALLGIAVGLFLVFLGVLVILRGLLIRAPST